MPRTTHNNGAMIVVVPIIHAPNVVKGRALH